MTRNLVSPTGGAEHGAHAPKRIRVLMLTTALGGGGAEMHMVRLANHLDRSRFDVHVASVRSGSYASLLRSDVPQHVLCPRPLPSSTLALAQAALPYRRLVASLQPDVVAAFLDGPGVLAILGSAGWGLRKKPRVVVGLQNCLSEDYSKFSIGGAATFGALKRTYPYADAVVSISEGVAKDLFVHVPECRNNTEVIYNATVEDSLFECAAEPIDEPLDAPGPLLVACGRLVEQKGFSTLIDAFARVRQSIPARLWILGEGPLRPALQAQVDGLGLTEHVRLLGFRRNPQRYMAKADLFVLSSNYEGLGMVLIEAMACATPVVATRCPYGPEEIVQDRVSGLLVPVRDSVAMAAALEEILTDDALRARLASAGKSRSEAFHATPIAKQYGALFERLAGAPGVETE